MGQFPSVNVLTASSGSDQLVTSLPSGPQLVRLDEHPSHARADFCLAARCRPSDLAPPASANTKPVTFQECIDHLKKWFR
jgi:hypothetical protein